MNIAYALVIFTIFCSIVVLTASHLEYRRLRKDHYLLKQKALRLQRRLELLESNKKNKSIVISC